MKLSKLIIITFLITAACFGQNKYQIGLNAGIFHPEASNEGFGIFADGIYNLSEHFDLSLSLGFLTSTQDAAHWGHPSEKATYSQFPLVFGAKYYIFNYFITPYFGIEAGPTYCHMERFKEIVEYLPSEHYTNIKVHTNGLSHVFNYNFGIRVSVPNNLNFFINIKIDDDSDEPSSYSMINGGFNLPIRL
ncbi:MAG: outer membrane beta-barrel protein [Bacteroidota bacterium]|nr:outer membrane beta-barrel protein [Bacteroidota bacterium]